MGEFIRKFTHEIYYYARGGRYAHNYYTPRKKNVKKWHSAGFYRRHLSKSLNSLHIGQETLPGYFFRQKVNSMARELSNEPAHDTRTFLEPFVGFWELADLSLSFCTPNWKKIDDTPFFPSDLQWMIFLSFWHANLLVVGREKFLIFFHQTKCVTKLRLSSFIFITWDILLRPGGRYAHNYYTSRKKKCDKMTFRWIL